MALSLSEVQRALPDRYSLEREIGRGGMATVFLARDVKHDREVAIKVLHPELAWAVGKERFLREIGTAAKLSHPHILALHDSGESEGLFFYVMPYVEGNSLRKRLSREKQLSVRDALKIASEIGDALAYSLGEGVIHRDVKPENILFRAGHAVLADFGVAQALAEPGKTKTHLTLPGGSPGTPAYMSPEQSAGGTHVDGRSDQYSLACVLYEMLSGRPVFSGSSTQEIVAKHRTSRPVPLRILRPAVPETVDQALMQALAKAPADRFPSMAEFTASLEAVTISGDRSATPPFPTASPSPRSWALPSAVLVVVVVAIGLFQVLRGIGSPAPLWENTWPEAVVVLPFATPGESGEESDLSREIAERTARDLDWWAEIQARGVGSLSGVITDLGIEEVPFRSSRNGIEVARAAGFEALLAITSRIRGDSAFVQATLHDAASASIVERSLSSQGLREDFSALITPISLGLLQIEEEAALPLNRGTTSLAAFRALVGGRQDFFASDVQAAEEAFHRSVESDSAYASAHSWLALAKYWRAETGGLSLSATRPEISRHSILAMDHASGITGLDSLHVSAFHSFQQGDFAKARTLYGEIRERDPDDLVAWLMAGEVEFQDPWMVVDDLERSRPRSDLTLAWRSYQRTTALRPTFEIGYARTFAIAEDIDLSLRIDACPLFPALRPELLAPGSGAGAENAEAFCPVFLDSVFWLSKNVFDTLSGPALERGSEEVFDQSVRMLNAWETFAPDSPTPKGFLADAILSRRDRIKVGSPEKLRHDAARALERVEAALLLKQDTIPEDLFRVANLQLVAGMGREANGTADKALSLHEALPDSMRSNLPLFAGNVFLATGRIEKAREVVYQHRSTRYIRDPGSDAMISYAGAEPVPYAVSVMGGGGVLGEPIRRELAFMDSTWNAAGYSDSQLAALRNGATMRMATGLVQDSSVLSDWGQIVDLDQHLWGALGFPADRIPSAEEYEAALNEALEWNDRAKRTFLIAWKARVSDSPEVAHRIFCRLDSMAFRAHSLDSGQGLRVVSLLYRAEALEEMGRFAEAEEVLQEFLSAWPVPDELAQQMVARAEAALQRIREKATGSGTP